MIYKTPSYYQPLRNFEELLEELVAISVSLSLELNKLLQKMILIFHILKVVIFAAANDVNCP